MTPSDLLVGTRCWGRIHWWCWVCCHWWCWGWWCWGWSHWPCCSWGWLLRCWFWGWWLCGSLRWWCWGWLALQIAQMMVLGLMALGLMLWLAPIQQVAALEVEVVVKVAPCRRAFSNCLSWVQQAAVSQENDVNAGYVIVGNLDLLNHCDTLNNQWYKYQSHCTTVLLITFTWENLHQSKNC